MRRIVLPVCSVLLIALSVACGAGGGDEGTEAVAGGGGGWTPPDRPADITGPLGSVTRATGGEASRTSTVVIEEGSGRFEAAAVTLSDQTELRRRTGSSYAEATVPDLAVGTRVEVWFDGPVAESFPYRAAPAR
jgi:hypothetical protein